MAAPKHKIFFGAPGNAEGNLTGKGGSFTGGGALVPCFTWDNDTLDFSGTSKKMFNCDYDLNVLTQKASSSGFTWDMNTVTMDTTIKIYN